MTPSLARPFPSRHLTFTALIGLLALLGVFYCGVEGLWAEAFAILTDKTTMTEAMHRVGPLAVVVLLALAVIVAPIPSGPIAMAAGAIYGPWEGGALTAAGALLGATMAFSLSRRFGYQPLSTSNLPVAGWITRPRSQVSLALAVLISRLIPFVSFDAVSYLAGLTALRARNFILATALGVLPASFAFAALGAGLSDMNTGAMLILACGVTLILPAGWMVARWWRGGSA